MAAASDAFDFAFDSFFLPKFFLAGLLEAPFTILAICDWPVYTDDDLLLPRASKSVISFFPSPIRRKLASLGQYSPILGDGRVAILHRTTRLLPPFVKDPFENCRTNAFLLDSNTWIKQQVSNLTETRKILTSVLSIIIHKMNLLK